MYNDYATKLGCSGLLMAVAVILIFFGLRGLFICEAVWVAYLGILALDHQRKKFQRRHSTHL